MAMLSLNTILLLAFILQSAVYYASNRKEDILPVILAGLASTAALGIYTLAVRRYQADLRNHILACVLVLFLGPAGCFIAIVCCAFNYILARNSEENFTEWLFNYLYADDASQSHSDKLYRRIVAGQENIDKEVDTEPLADIMESGTIEQKQQALIKAVKYFKPSMAPILQAGLRDSENLIRVQAAGGLAKLKDDYHKRYSKYERRIKENRESPDDLIRFTEICEAYVHAGLLDSEKASDEIKDSVKLYESGLAKNPANIDLMTAFVRMLMINKDNDKALLTLRKALASVDYPPQPLRNTAMELLFDTGNFEELRKFAAKWLAAAPPGEADERIPLWAGNGLDVQKLERGGA